MAEDLTEEEWAKLEQQLWNDERTLLVHSHRYYGRTEAGRLWRMWVERLGVYDAGEVEDPPPPEGYFPASR